MELIKKIFSDKGRVGVAIVCLLMLSVMAVSAMTGETLAATSDDYYCPLGGGTPVYGTISSGVTGYYCSIQNVSVESTTYKAGDSLEDDADCAKYLKEVGYTNVTNGSGYYCTYVAKQKTTVKDRCYQCNSNSNILKWETSSSADEVCPAGYRENTSIEEAACKTYKITYNANGGSGGPTITYKSHGNKVMLSTNEPTRTGYVFRGWTTTAGGVASRQPGASYNLNEDLELFAVWTENSSSGEEGGGEGETITYSVSYKNNGGTGTMSNSTYTKGVSQALRKNRFTRTGYAFNGWNTKADGTGNKYTDGQSISISSNLTLYAQWKINKVNIKYNTNGGTIKETNGYNAKNGIVYIDEEVFVYSIDYGKATSSDGLSDYNNSNFINITSEGYATPNGAEWICLSGDCTKGKTYNQSKQYNHSDFCDASNGDCTVVLGVNWIQNKVNKVNINYNPNGGNVASSTDAGSWTVVNNLINLNSDVLKTTIDYGRKLGQNGLIDYYSGINLKVTKTGYDAKAGAEWICLSGDCTKGKTYDQSKQYNHSDFCDASNGDCTVVLGVNWIQNKVNKVNINYNPNGGNVASSTDAGSWAVVNNLINLNNDVLKTTIEYGSKLRENGLVDNYSGANLKITKTGYLAKTGAEWICLSGCSTNNKTFDMLTSYSHSDFCDASNGDCTVVLGVNWQANRYTIKYNGNGSTSGSTASSYHEYDIAKNLTKNGYERTGYTFYGWNTKEDGSGTNYIDGETVKNLTFTTGTTVNLYAQWLENSSDNEGDNPTTPSTGNDNNGNLGNASNQGNNNIDKSPQTGMIATFLVSLICISSLGGVVYYRKKVKN